MEPRRECKEPVHCQMKIEVCTAQDESGGCRKRVGCMNQSSRACFNLGDKKSMRNLRRLALGLVFWVVMISAGGCASPSTMKLQPDNTIRLSHKGGSPNTRLSILRSEARWYAYLYCQSQKRNVRVMTFEDAEGPFFSGNFPRTDIIFSCVGS